MLEVTRVRKVFNRRVIFSDVSFRVESGSVFAIAGRNGSGKSTLLKLLAGILPPSKGSMRLFIDGKEISPERHFSHLGFVAPYFQLYEEFTAGENLRFCKSVRGLRASTGEMNALLSKVKLADRENDIVSTFSSGMKQRLKYACALLPKPEVLLLDEPSANLDGEGKRIVMDILREQRARGIALIATNEPEEVLWSDASVDLNVSVPVTRS